MNPAQRKSFRVVIGALGACLLCISRVVFAEEFTFTVNQAIPDNSRNGLADAVMVTSSIGAITSLEVTLNITGGWNGDLYAYLVHEPGFVVLLNRPGRTASQPWGYGDPGMAATFHDPAANGDVHRYRVTLSGDPGQPLGGPLTNSWAPDGRTANPVTVVETDVREAFLSSFNGQNANGRWVLFVADLVSADIATLDSWKLKITGASGIAPSITAQPASQTIECGGSATLSVTADGTGPISYQWQFEGAAIAGATNAGLLLSAVSPASAGIYSVIVSNAFGVVTSGTAQLTVVDTTPPLVTCAPDRTVEVGTAWDFTAPTAMDACGTVASTVVVSTTTNTVIGGLSSATRVWRATDNSGNPATCSQTVWFPGPVQISGAIKYYSNNNAVTNVTMRVDGDATLSAIAENGVYAFLVNPGGSYQVTPMKGTNVPPNAAVSAADVTLIRRHILASQRLNSPYKIIAADVNGSSTVSAIDVTVITRLILGTVKTLPAGLWTFVPSNYQFSDPANPWRFATNRSYTGLLQNAPDQDFVAIKMGDVNGSWTNPPVRLASAIPTADQGALVRTPLVSVGQHEAFSNIITVPITASGFDAVSSVQFTLGWDPTVLAFLSVNSPNLPGLTEENLNRDLPGRLAFLWAEPNGQNLTVADNAVILAVTFAIIGRNGNSSDLFYADTPTPQELAKDGFPVNAEWQSGRVVVQTGTDVGERGWIRIDSNGVYRITFLGQPGTRCTLQFANSLSEPNWATLTEGNFDATGRWEYVDSPSASVVARYYRLLTQH